MAMILTDAELLPGINPLSDRTRAERNKFAAQLDNFATFQWCGIDMFSNFGAFIINEKKGSLKMYNGASYKNTYSKTQFQDGYTNLTGVTFDTQTISFTIGVYWISIEDYRLLMNKLHPYEIGMLSFSFDKTYGYYCKLQSIKDSTRYILGQENNHTAVGSNSLQYSRLVGGSTNKPGPRYYTELNLTFDIIGAQCAKEITPNLYKFEVENNTYKLEFNPKTESHQDPGFKFISDLDYPIRINIPFVYSSTGTGTLILYASIYHENTLKSNVELFRVSLKNIDTTVLSLVYDSEHGLLYWDVGEQLQLLTLLSTNEEGKRIVSALSVNRFFWPGRLDFPAGEDYVYTLELQTTDVVLYSPDEDAETDDGEPEVWYSAQRRTNVL